MIYAYLRVSTDRQDEQNQKQGVDSKAEQLGVTIDKYIIDHVSGTKDPNERNLGKLIRRAKQGDIILISEISRLARRIYMLFRILETLLEKGVKVYSVKDGYSLDGTIQSKVLAFAFGMAAEIERDMMSKRTKEALAFRKQQGVKLGRPIGSKTRNHKLDRYRNRIINYKAASMSIAKMSRLCKVTDKTMRKYIAAMNL